MIFRGSAVSTVTPVKLQHFNMIGIAFSLPSDGNFEIYRPPQNTVCPNYRI